MYKICFITTVSITIKAFLLDLIKKMNESSEFEIHVICNKDDEFASSLPDYINYHPIKMNRGINLDGVNAILEMSRIFKKEKFDLVQYSTPNASCYASIASKIARVPVRLYCQWGIAYVGFSGIKRRIFKQIEKLVCTNSTWIEPDSKSNLIFAHNEKLYEENKGSVIWNGSACGVNLKKFNYLKKEEYRREIRLKLNIPDNSFVYGFVGRITGDKGVNELFQAYKKIVEDNDNTYLILVGNPEKSDSVNSELFSWAKSSQKVIFCGYTNEVEKYLSAMDCYILPSYREGFGMGVVEAEAMGVPVIVSDIPGPIDAMENNKTGIIVEKKDVGGLKKAMEYLLLNPQLLSCYSKNSIMFSSDKFEQGKLFEHIIKDRKQLIRLSADNK